MEFEANREGFPNGLKHTVEQIRSKQPNVKHIAVWHALVSTKRTYKKIAILKMYQFGYWGGIAPEGLLAQKYKTRTVLNRKGLREGEMTVIDPEDIGRFYEDAYT